MRPPLHFSIRDQFRHSTTALWFLIEAAATENTGVRQDTGGAIVQETSQIQTLKKIHLTSVEDVIGVRPDIRSQNFQRRLTSTEMKDYEEAKGLTYLTLTTTREIEKGGGEEKGKRIIDIGNKTEKPSTSRDTEGVVLIRMWIG
ncbi:unnamed protein product [Cylicostephanus goldi]|uniref:Uncharacterized protein n=1 Tax=Cylicostephanus goldi TaxID=71465 RepID=A0A3P7PIM8_CYLGO|nr:unnamed protein product [Cylicostephanus goldi]